MCGNCALSTRFNSEKATPTVFSSLRLCSSFILFFKGWYCASCLIPVCFLVSSCFPRFFLALVLRLVSQSFGFFLIFLLPTFLFCLVGGIVRCVRFASQFIRLPLCVHTACFSPIPAFRATSLSPYILFFLLFIAVASCVIDPLVLPILRLAFLCPGGFAPGWCLSLLNYYYLVFVHDFVRLPYLVHCADLYV